MERLKHILCAAVLTFALALAPGCGPSGKIRRVRQQRMGASLALSRSEIKEDRQVIAQSRRDTLSVRDDEGNRILIMKAVRDEQTGEMVATDVIDAAVITARFRNVAERGGRVDLRFEIIVPAAMQDTRWQLRFYPDMFIQEDSVCLEPVFITGENYRREQLRGYQQYERFLRTIITDSTRLIDIRSLEIFIRRNLPALYAFKNDSTEVSDEVFRSHYGVSEQEAVRHYTRQFAVALNERRKSRRGAMWSRYVKSPILTEGIRLDTVMRNADGDFVYHYTQTVATRPQLRKVDIVLRGDIYEADRRLYAMTPSAPLTFYISSLSAFTDGTQRFVSKTLRRKAAVNTACYVDFRSGTADIDPGLGNNRGELARIRSNIVQLLTDRRFEMDSIVIGASASPEGPAKANEALSERRAAAVAAYFERFIGHYRDSVKMAEKSGLHVRLDKDYEEEAMPPIRFISRSRGENWPMLSFLVDRDSTLRGKAAGSYTRHLSIADPDLREQELRKEPYYTYLRSTLYPRLRTVRFDFHLHRKGMITDTLVTTEPDTTYMKGVAALRERDYRKALEYLREYRDFNTAIAYVCLDYNASAMSILGKLEPTPQVKYMLAILHARSGDDEKAVQHYLDACREEPSYVFRGNLDPEIRILIERYRLNKD